MKKTDKQLKGLYDRFHDEMEKVELPAPEEMIANWRYGTHIQNSIASVDSPSAPVELRCPTEKRTPLSRRYTLYAAAAAILVAIISITMLLRSYNQSPNTDRTVIADNNNVEKPKPLIADDSLSTVIPDNMVPKADDNTTLPELIVEKPNATAPTTTDSVASFTHEASPLLATTSNDETEPQNTEAQANDSAAADTTAPIVPDMREVLFENSQRAMKEQRNKKNKKKYNAQKIFEEKKNKDNNIYMESPKTQTLYHHN